MGFQNQAGAVAHFVLHAIWICPEHLNLDVSRIFFYLQTDSKESDTSRRKTVKQRDLCIDESDFDRWNEWYHESMSNDDSGVMWRADDNSYCRDTLGWYWRLFAQNLDIQSLWELYWVVLLALCPCYRYLEIVPQHFCLQLWRRLEIQHIQRENYQR